MFVFIFDRKRIKKKTQCITFYSVLFMFMLCSCSFIIAVNIVTVAHQRITRWNSLVKLWLYRNINSFTFHIIVIIIINGKQNLWQPKRDFYEWNNIWTNWKAIYIVNGTQFSLIVFMDGIKQNKFISAIQWIPIHIYNLNVKIHNK